MTGHVGLDEAIERALYRTIKEEKNKVSIDGKKEIKEAWLQIMAILDETGYSFMYQSEISKVANVIRKELWLNN